jgi:iduronate 2-sulfatase
MKYRRICLVSVLMVLMTVPNARSGERLNVLLICVDDLRPELNCFGAKHISSPHIDQLAAKGRSFQRHYVQAPTCGASRYAMLTGRYGPAGNGAFFQRPPSEKQPSMPEWFRQKGYTTVSVGKVSHHPGGRGGADWDDETKIEIPRAWDRHLMPSGAWKHPRGAMHGLANGEIRVKAGEMALFQAVKGPDTIYPDGLIADEAREQLRNLAGDSKKPFFLAVGFIRPHLPFGAPERYLDRYRDVKFPDTPHPKKPTWKSTWHGSHEFMKYKRWGKNPNSDADFALEVRKHYAACVSYADEQVGKLLAELDALKLRDNTVIVLWGDHGWHLGEHAIWGKHSLFEESLHSPLIIASPKMKSPGKGTQAVVESIDIYPTLCELTGTGAPDFCDGESLLPHLVDPALPGHPAISYAGSSRTIRTDTHRLVVGKKHSELYDFREPDGGGVNRTQNNADRVEALRLLLANEFE